VRRGPTSSVRRVNGATLTDRIAELIRAGRRVDAGAATPAELVGCENSIAALSCVFAHRRPEGAPILSHDR